MSKRVGGVVPVVVAVVACGLVLLAPELYQLRHTAADLLGLGTNPALQRTCDVTQVPQLQLRVLPGCAEVQGGGSKVPCVERGLVSRAALDTFLGDNAEETILMRGFPAGHEKHLGNPLFEGLFRGLREDGVDHADMRNCTIGEYAAGASHCEHTHASFRALNYSAYAAVEETLGLDTFTRADMFLHTSPVTKASASFHSNQFEESATLQILGEKIWLLLDRVSYSRQFQTYPITAYNAAYDACPDGLSQVKMEVVRARPGDVIRFPKAWAHTVYTLPGPNFMVNFRRWRAKLWQPRDVLALASSMMSSTTQHSKANCPKPPLWQQSAFLHGHPKHHFTYKRQLGHDMRCEELLNLKVIDYKKHVLDAVPMSDALDRGIFDQVLAAVGDT